MAEAVMSWRAAILLIVLYVVLGFAGPECKGEGFEVAWLAYSHHTRDRDITNEQHEGLCLGYKGWGYCNYINSYGDRSNLVQKSLGVLYRRRGLELAHSAGVGDNYDNVDLAPFYEVSASYKGFRLSVLPGELIDEQNVWVFSLYHRF